MDLSASHLSWLWISLGLLLGVAGLFAAILWLGGKTAKRMRLEDRGDCDRPLPEPFPPDQVVAVYKRRKRYHKHGRHYYQHQHSEKPK